MQKLQSEKDGEDRNSSISIDEGKKSSNFGFSLQDSPVKDQELTENDV